MNYNQKNFQVNVKSLQSASVILGKFIKAKAVKKTDEEVLAGFGAEKGDSEEDSLGQSMKADGKKLSFYINFVNFCFFRHFRF